MQLAPKKMLSKRKVVTAEDEKEAPPAKKTKEKSKETAEHSEEVARILEDYCQGLFKLLQIIAVKLDKITDGLAEILIMDSLNEFDGRIREKNSPIRG